DNLQRLDGTASRHGLVLSLLVALVWIHRNGTRFTWNGGSRLFIAGLAAGLTLVMGVLLGGCVGGALLGLAGLAATLVLARRIPETSVRRSVLLATWLLAAWFIGLGLVTPSYAAYPRLLLPWIVATWLAGGLAISHLGAFLAGASHLNGGLFPGAMAAISPNRTLGPIRGGSAAIALTLVLAAIFAAEWWGGVWDIPAWEDRTALRRLARQPLANGEGTTEMAPLDKSQCAIYTLSEPALLFQWRLAGYELVRPVSSLDLAHPTGSEPLLPTFLAIGEQAERGAGFAADFNQGTSRLKEIQMSELDLSCLVLLDNRFPAGRPDGRGDKPRYRLRFYRLQ
ncbi:MAG: hypothetical protein ACKV0T_11515, partial [Planctomycetales bacterium]